MIYRGAGLLADDPFGSSSTPFPLSRSKMSLFLNLTVCRRSSCPWEERKGEGDVERAKSNNGKKACSSINHSTLSAGPL
jgi:hypothetical protein